MRKAAVTLATGMKTSRRAPVVDLAKDLTAGTSRHRNLPQKVAFGLRVTGMVEPSSLPEHELSFTRDRRASKLWNVAQIYEIV